MLWVIGLPILAIDQTRIFKFAFFVHSLLTWHDGYSRRHSQYRIYCLTHAIFFSFSSSSSCSFFSLCIRCIHGVFSFLDQLLMG